jgi:alpha-L-arabinofuranosidase
LKLDRCSPLSTYLREPDLEANISPDGKILRIYSVNSTGEARNVKFRVPESLGGVRGGETYVLGDSDPTPDSEAMNSHDDPTRVGVKTAKASLSGSEFEYRFAPFSVTLLELELPGKN